MNILPFLTIEREWKPSKSLTITPLDPLIMAKDLTVYKLSATLRYRGGFLYGGLRLGEHSFVWARSSQQSLWGFANRESRVWGQAPQASQLVMTAIRTENSLQLLLGELPLLCVEALTVDRIIGCVDYTNQTYHNLTLSL